jgi:hypothetical protein
LPSRWSCSDQKGKKAGKERYKDRQGKIQRQASIGTKAGKERYKDRQGKIQRQARIGTKAGKERQKIRQAKESCKVKNRK